MVSRQVGEGSIVQHKWIKKGFFDNPSSSLMLFFRKRYGERYDITLIQIHLDIKEREILRMREHV